MNNCVRQICHSSNEAYRRCQGVAVNCTNRKNHLICLIWINLCNLRQKVLSDSNRLNALHRCVYVEPALQSCMGKKVIIGSLLLLGGFFLGYHAYHGLTDWQYRNRAALGETNIVPYLEIVFTLFLAIAGLWLLFKK